MTSHPTHVTPAPQTAADVVQHPHSILDGTTPALCTQRRRKPDESWEYLTLWAAERLTPYRG